MKKLFAVLCLTLSVSGLAAHAAEKPKTEQQNKMAMCNKDAGDKKGDERKKFMSECLKKKPEMPASAKGQLAPKDAMVACNKAATGKKGDDRKKFMSACLKAKGPDNMK